MPGARGRPSEEGPPAVILGGGIIAIAVARSLGRAGVRVYALGDGAWDSVRHSRYCAVFVDLGSGAGVQERYLEWLESGPRGSVILPCSDDGLELIVRARAHLVQLGYALVEANDEVLLAMLDKHRTYALARRAGISTPRSITLGRMEDLDGVGSQVGFPCALKPRHSHLFARHFGLRQKLFVAHDRRELELMFGRLARLDLDVIASEIIPGTDDRFASYYTYLDQQGEPLLHFTKRKLRQYPPSFGLGSYHVTDWNEEIARLGLEFCQGVGLRGLATVEFKLDARDGEFKLIECNQRFTLGTPLLRLAGIDLPLLVYNRLAGRHELGVDHYRTGVRMWFPLDDARAFLSYRRRGELTLADWTKSLLHRQHFPVFAWDDPQPSLTECRQLAGVARKKLAARLRRPVRHWMATPRKSRTSTPDDR
jgi:D-aspartate ligase